MLGADGESRTVPVIRIEDQCAGARGEEPVVLEEAFWTCAVPKGWRFAFSANRDIVLTAGLSGVAAE